MRKTSPSGGAYVSGYLRQPLRSLDEALLAHVAGARPRPDRPGQEPERPARPPRQARAPQAPRQRPAPPDLGRRLAELEARRQWLARSGNALGARAVANEIAALAAALGEPAAAGRARRPKAARRRLRVA